MNERWIFHQKIAKMIYFVIIYKKMKNIVKLKESDLFMRLINFYPLFKKKILFFFL